MESPLCMAFFVLFTLGLAREHDLFGFDWTVVRFD
jgi:hypothetical protein